MLYTGLERFKKMAAETFLSRNRVAPKGYTEETAFGRRSGHLQNVCLRMLSRHSMV